jgi:hypothetical protein
MDIINIITNNIEEALVKIRYNFEESTDDDRFTRRCNATNVLSQILNAYVGCKIVDRAINLAKKIGAFIDDGALGNFYELQTQFQTAPAKAALLENDLTTATNLICELSSRHQVNAVDNILDLKLKINDLWIDDFLYQYKNKSLSDRKDFFYEDEYTLFKRLNRIDDFFEYLEARNGRIATTSFLFLAEENKNLEVLRDEYLNEAWDEVIKKESNTNLLNTGLPSKQSYLYKVFVHAIKLNSKELALKFLDELKKTYPGIHTDYIGELLGSDERKSDLLYAILTPEGTEGISTQRKPIFNSQKSLFDCFLFIGALPVLLESASVKNLTKLLIQKSTAKLGFNKLDTLIVDLIRLERISALKEIVKNLEELQDSKNNSIIATIINELSNNTETLEIALDIASSLKDKLLRNFFLKILINSSLRLGDDKIYKKISSMLLDEATDSYSLNQLGYTKAIECAVLSERPFDKYYREISKDTPNEITSEDDYRKILEVATAAALVKDTKTLIANVNLLIKELNKISVSSFDIHGTKAIEHIKDLLHILPYIYGIKEARENQGNFNRLLT